MGDDDDLTRILAATRSGDKGAAERLLTIIYSELRRLAAAKLAREPAGHTLQPTALVNEAYLRLLVPNLWAVDDTSGSHAHSAASKSGATANTWNSRGHFFAAAAEAMRRVLIDHARQKKRLKRGGDFARTELDHIDLAISPPSSDVLALNEALSQLEAIDEAKANVVKLRYFAGLTIEQTAEATGVSVATVKRQWYYARAWLHRRIVEA